MKLTKKRYLIGFTVAVLVLAVIRVAFPAIAEPKEEKLLERGLKRIHFLRHRYIMLYKVDGDEAIVVYIFHETEDYLNKIL